MKRRILIVEDEAVTSVMLEKTLKELGYEVVGSAFDGEEAIELAREKQPDIVLMDIRLQGEMDGIETAKRIYQQYRIPIIYLTAHSDENTIRRAVESGPFGYLIKPFKERELYSNIEMVAHKHKLYQTTTAQRPSQAEPEPVPEPQPRQTPRAQAPVMKPGDHRLAVLAIQSIPHPVILFNTSGNILFTNNAFRLFFKLDPQKAESIQAIDDLPDLFTKIWTSGRDRFREGKGFAINGPLPVKGVNRRVRIDMIPLMDRGTLEFISSVILPEPAGVGSGTSAIPGMNTLLDEAESRLKEIRYLASPEDTYRMRRISIYSTDVLKKIRELRGISYPRNEKEKGPNQMVTG
jgi:DNA-binding NarL/FixJ family response regulator